MFMYCTLVLVEYVYYVGIVLYVDDDLKCVSYNCDMKVFIKNGMKAHISNKCPLLVCFCMVIILST